MQPSGDQSAKQILARLPVQVVHREYGYLFGETMTLGQDGLTFQIALPYLLRGEVEIMLEHDAESKVRCQAEIIRHGYSASGRYAFGVRLLAFEPGHQERYIQILNALRAAQSPEAEAPQSD